MPERKAFRSTPSSPKGNYQAIDSGNGRKLEAAGPYVLDRPETLASYSPALSPEEWKERTQARFLEGDKGKRGTWEKNAEIPEEWEVELQTERLSLNAICELGDSKHFGFFPEQAIHWDLLNQRLGSMNSEGRPKALLLFAYTGMASMACKMAGADVFHVEASKRTITWARNNMERNGLSDIRWVLEDAMKFAQREAKRGHRYQAIVLDTPSFGRGPKGEIWKAEELAPELFETCTKLLDKEEHLMIGNLYSSRVDMKDLERSIESYSKTNGSRKEFQDLYIPAQEGNGIPAGSSIILEKGSKPGEGHE